MCVCCGLLICRTPKVLEIDKGSSIFTVLDDIKYKSRNFKYAAVDPCIIPWRTIQSIRITKRKFDNNMFYDDIIRAFFFQDRFLSSLFHLAELLPAAKMWLCHSYKSAYFILQVRIQPLLMTKVLPIR